MFSDVYFLGADLSKRNQRDQRRRPGFYDAVFDELLKHGIEPVVTINHFDIPMYLADEYDGWSNRKVIDYFLFFCETIFTRYQDKVKYWMTFNEINF